MSFSHFKALALASLLLAGASLQAAPPKREGTLGGGKGQGPIMSMAQLRTCMTQQDRIGKQNDEAAKRKQQLTTEMADIDRSAAKLKEDLPAVDRTNQEAIDAFVARGKAHDLRIEAYEASETAFNNQVQALNVERAAFAKSCEGRRYLEDDYKDIKAGK